MTTTAPPNVALYELADARDILDLWLEETGGEVTPALEELLTNLTGLTKEKIERVALYVVELLVTAKSIKEERDRLAHRMAAKEKAAEGLKAYLKGQMERLELTKVEGLLCTVALQANPPAVKTALEGNELWALEECVPYVIREEKIVYRLDRERVLASWKAGTSLPAAIQVERGSHVRIR